MTELGRILTTSLAALEQELTATQEIHKKTLEDHAQALHRLKQNMSRIEAEQKESAQHLQHLSDIHANLEPLLLRLSAILSGR